MASGRTNPSIFETQTLWKTPAEMLEDDIDFVDDIPTSDSIKVIGAGSATAVTITDSDGDDVTTTLLVAYKISGTKINVRLQSGTNEENYLIKAVAEMTTSGEKRERYKRLKVRTIV